LPIMSKVIIISTKNKYFNRMQSLSFFDKISKKGDCDISSDIVGAEEKFLSWHDNESKLYVVLGLPPNTDYEIKLAWPGNLKKNFSDEEDEVTLILHDTDFPDQWNHGNNFYSSQLSNDNGCEVYGFQHADFDMIGHIVMEEISDINNWKSRLLKTLPEVRKWQILNRYYCGENISDDEKGFICPLFEDWDNVEGQRCHHKSSFEDIVDKVIQDLENEVMSF